MRLIDADALEPDAEYDDGEYWAYSRTQIENAPTIEPEGKKGKWIKVGGRTMINEKIVPVSPYGFRFPTETEMAIDETLKLCGISGEDASMFAIEIMKKLGKSDEIPACCCRGLAEGK